MSADPTAANPGTSGAVPELPTHSPDGVDLTLIRWMLSLTPAERLRVLQGNAQAVVRIRNANTH